MAEDTTATGQTAGEAGSSATSGATGGQTAAQNAGETTTSTAQTGQTSSDRTFSQADVDRIVKDRLAAEREREQKRQETEDAKKRGDYEKLAAGEKERADSAEAALRTERAENAILKAATKENLIDPETVSALILGKVEFDKDGRPTNVDALVKQIAKEKPFLVKQEGQASSSASATNPAATTGRARFDPKNPPSWGGVFRK